MAEAARHNGPESNDSNHDSHSTVPTDEFGYTGLEPIDAFLDFRDEHAEILMGNENTRALRLPYLLHEFISAASARNNPDLHSVYNTEDIKANIQQFQGEYDVMQPEDVHSAERRISFKHQYMRLLGPFVDMDIELRDASYWASLANRVGNADLIEAADTVLTAYGMSLAAKIRSLRYYN
jgi:hypothetical protein